MVVVVVIVEKSKSERLVNGEVPMVRGYFFRTFGG